MGLINKIHKFLKKYFTNTKRLVVYTDLEGKIHTQVMKLNNPDQNEIYCVKIPEGRVTVLRKRLLNDWNCEYTDLFIEIGQERLAYLPKIIDQSFKTWKKHASYN